MCGIAGIVARDPGTRVDESRLARMRDALRHRGPDGSGLRVDGPVGLAHTRLAIVDVANGEQPMSNERGDVWVVFNGEIYNHADLRPGLEAKGHHYRTRCDTETIVHSYEEQGDRVVDALQGMFAFAIWDGPRQRLLLARDRLGLTIPRAGPNPSADAALRHLRVYPTADLLDSCSWSRRPPG